MISLPLVQLSWRRLIGWHRAGLLAFLAVLALLPLLIGGVYLASAGLDASISLDPSGFFSGLMLGFGMPILYPIIALILMTAVLREELQSGTFIYLWMKPIGRGSIIGSKFFAALAVALGVSFVSLSATALLLGASGVLWGRLVIDLIAGLIAYGAFFFLLGVGLGRPMIWGFAYILAWEGSFSHLSAAASTLSIRRYAEGLGNSLLGLPHDLPFVTCLVVLVGIAIVSLLLAGWRFAGFEFPGGEEG